MPEATLCAQGRDLRVALLLAGGALALYLATGRFFIDNIDGENYFLTTEAILRGDIWLEQGISGDWWAERGWKGRPYNPHGIGHPAAAIPFYLAARLVEPYLSVVSPQLVRRAAVTLLPPVVTATTVGLLFWFARRLGFRARPSLAAAVIFAVGTPAWPYARYYFSEPLAGLLLLATLYYLWQARSSDDPWAGAAAGALAGFAGLTRPPLWPLIFLLAAALAYRRRGFFWPGVGAYLALAAPSLGLHAWYNYARFGSMLTQDPAGPNRFGLDIFPVGLYGQLLSPGKSIFVYCPAVLLAAAGWPQLWRRSAFCGGAALGVLAYHLLLYSAWSDWSGGWCWGPRFLVAALPVAWLAVPPALERVSARPPARIAAAAILAVSFSVQVLGVSAFYMAHLDRVFAKYGKIASSYFTWADSPVVGAVTTLKHLRWSPLDEDLLRRVRDRAGATEELKHELRNTLDIWPAYLRRFGFGRWVWGAFGAGITLALLLWVLAWREVSRATCATGQTPQRESPREC